MENIKQSYEDSITVVCDETTGLVTVHQCGEPHWNYIYIEKQSIPALIEALKKYVE